MSDRELVPFVREMYALVRLLAHHHYDTCSHSLSEQYPCDCGHDRAKALVARIEGNY